jgi:hypothetical protein
MVNIHGTKYPLINVKPSGLKQQGTRHIFHFFNKKRLVKGRDQSGGRIWFF